MNTSLPLPRSGGQIVAKQLLLHGVKHVFCVPGESYLDLLNAFYDLPQIELINARHEAGAAYMAEAYGKLTGEPGIALVTRGPGACHAAVGVHTAFQDSTPMILLIGQVSRDASGREAFQEVDFQQMFGRLAKWVAQVERPERLPEYIARAFRCAVSGRPGPVVLSLPEDMLAEAVQTADAPRYRKAAPHIDAESIEQIASALREAERPLLLVGGPGWTDAACHDIVTFAEANGLPAACSFRRQDIFANDSPCFVGDFGTSGPPSLIRRVDEVDLLLVVGARLGEMTTQGYSLISQPLRQRLIHIHASSEELGRVYAPEIAVVSDVETFARQAAEHRWIEPQRWRSWRTTLRTEYEADTTPSTNSAWPLDCAQVISELRSVLPADAIVTLDAGNHTGWPQRYFRFGRPGRQLGSTNGSMGYSVPAAVAASLVTNKLVVGCVGDGGFMMSGQELATAVQHGGCPIVLLFNNSMYGTIRMHQELAYPGRTVGTSLVNPDFVRMAEAMGCYAERVTETGEFLPAFERAQQAGRAALLELVVDPGQVSTRASIDQLRARAGRAQPAAGIGFDLDGAHEPAQ